jgi:hypothetical protein
MTIEEKADPVLVRLMAQDLADKLEQALLWEKKAGKMPPITIKVRRSEVKDNERKSD